MKKALIAICLTAIALSLSAQADVASLKKAESKGSMDAARELAERYMLLYDFDAAGSHARTWESLLKKDRKMSASDREAATEAIEELKERALTGTNMLERVERIVILDSIVVDKDEFFSHYRLSPEAGRLYGGEMAPEGAKPRVVHMPQTAAEIFYAVPGPDSLLQLTSAQMMGEAYVDPMPLGDALGQGGDADYMFMESDGMTFYFAHNGEGSLGGYDIFMSRRLPDGTVYEPQNMGMPYNSPYDDYMLAIDEEANLGWWATDRNQIPGKVTIYVFRPNAMRVNYDPDDPKIKDWAFIKSVVATQDGERQAPSYLEDVDEPRKPAQFSLSMGNGKIYTNISQFKVPEAIYVMQDLLARQQEMAQMQAQLQALRERYAQGDRTVTQDILNLERRLLAAPRIIALLKNQVIQLETAK